MVIDIGRVGNGIGFKGGSRQVCARIRARDFSDEDALTIASMLPGIEGHYRQPGLAAQCWNTQLHMSYVM